MRKYVFTALALVGALSLVSWGFKGHRAIASIAQKHLTSNTAYVVSAYLNGQSMSEVSTWADENKNPQTASWHYLNLPLGLNHEAFVKAVSQSDGNVYSAIVKVEAQLKDKSLSVAQKQEALKYLIHLIGDAHQPMHVSRKEDKGGNTIQLRFDQKGTNLHSLWDSKLIDHEGLSVEDIVKHYDVATAADISKWQADSPMEWIWESYQLSSQIYSEVKPGQTIDEVYYQKYMPVIRERINQAGIRLAGELNRLLDGETAPKAESATPVVVTKGVPVARAELVDIKNVGKFTGKLVTVKAKAYSSKDIGSMILVNLGAAYPNQLLSVAIKGAAKAAAVKLDGKMVTVTGQVIDYKGKPEIIVTDVNQLKVQ